MRPVKRHKAYHAHVYFDENSKKVARTLCDTVATEFVVSVGRFHERCVGPHTRWSCQIAFSDKVFDELIPWLDAERNGLSVLVHGMTGDNLKDHTEYAYWLGTPVELKLDGFRADT
ncbi:DOPA 4,5-dioxygenase family protein [Aestuariirhabdus sp. Z084]|uniref:DOPA 4,5-dioxygenase family protein n=1 Tax=Aestuariirhabdus haliotis TaxID=2918751 RepID=UPI00201B370A|nr:DOPA 4,5-dioxygenase family protein [Aestuariirhabdus haliotis]MCL6416564.1 DOPA 4,5-dioxygenase family protein [Aestuariirhabdus haliotis]MCL6420569.1 DOPA 4,5-dioxygenase family protein [Aestuariirhabdus haliotis]